MSEVKYSKEHEWIKVEGDVGTIGITQHATEMLGDIVFVLSLIHISEPTRPY